MTICRGLPWCRGPGRDGRAGGDGSPCRRVSAPGAPRHGLARQLFHRAIDWSWRLEKPRIGRVRLWAHEENARAEALYGRLGFVRTGASMADPRSFQPGIARWLCPGPESEDLLPRGGAGRRCHHPRVAVAASPAPGRPGCGAASGRVPAPASASEPAWAGPGRRPGRAGRGAPGAVPRRRCRPGRG
jgi:hypothetical protein